MIFKKTQLPKNDADNLADDIQTEQKLRDAAHAAEDALVESLSLACHLVDLKIRPENRGTGGLSLRAAWPEGAAAREATQQWCVQNGVPCLPEETDGTHREHNTAHKPQPGFGVVNQPIAPGSAEWKSASGQECIETEKNISTKSEGHGT